MVVSIRNPIMGLVLCFLWRPNYLHEEYKPYSECPPWVSFKDNFTRIYARLQKVWGKPWLSSRNVRPTGVIPFELNTFRLLASRAQPLSHRNPTTWEVRSFICYIQEKGKLSFINPPPPPKKIYWTLWNNKWNEMMWCILWRNTVIIIL